MNGTESPESQKPPPSSAGTNGHASTNSSLAAKKRKKDGLKPIITMEGASPQSAIGVALEQSGQRGRNLSCLTPTYTISCVLHSFAPVEDGVAEEPAGH
ncbi:hypothetical protein Neosp_003280 [[Neocosmospora] mangrovei]